MTIANLLINLSVQEFLKSVSILQRYNRKFIILVCLVHGLVQAFEIM